MLFYYVENSFDGDYLVNLSRCVFINKFDGSNKGTMFYYIELCFDKNQDVTIAHNITYENATDRDNAFDEIRELVTEKIQW